jgi:hypothetical protein
MLRAFSGLTRAMRATASSITQTGPHLLVFMKGRDAHKVRQYNTMPHLMPQGGAVQSRGRVSDWRQESSAQLLANGRKQYVSYHHRVSQEISQQLGSLVPLVSYCACKVAANEAWKQIPCIPYKIQYNTPVLTPCCCACGALHAMTIAFEITVP